MGEGFIFRENKDIKYFTNIGLSKDVVESNSSKKIEIMCKKLNPKKGNIRYFATNIQI